MVGCRLEYLIFKIDDFDRYFIFHGIIVITAFTAAVIVVVFIYSSSLFFRNIYYSDLKRFDRFDEFYLLIKLFNRTVQFRNIVNLIRRISGVGDLIVVVFVIVFG
jgi:hypothetical protein